ncbi:MAG: carbohydrate kinase [Leptolyngbyaceae cyanobacterium SM1_1_3]|nr:carbohydrate kinase [Leptolyngbyaceae cyanobacterium SM1_1_3]NJN04237.1 carbohydrate kinase [Leptolyngbyaceae cyanobacterium RM1_1_2]
MSDSSVVCLGEALIDCLADRLGVPLAAVESWTPHPGGAPANVACALAKLGTAVRFVGCLGSDQWGDALLALLQNRGVDCTYLQRHADAPTRQVYVLRDRQGSPTFAGFSQPDPAQFADARLAVDQIASGLFEQAQFLVTGTLGLAYNPTGEAIRWALQRAQERSVKIAVDINWRPMFWPQPAIAPAAIRQILPAVDFLKLSADEADWLFDTQDPAAIARQLETLQGVLVTAGGAGCRYWFAGHTGQFPAFAVDSEDATGAGDAFLAGFLHKLIQGGLEQLSTPASSQAVIVYASAVGALTTTRLGAIAAQPSSQEVEAFLYLQQSLG